MNQEIMSRPKRKKLKKSRSNDWIILTRKGLSFLSYLFDGQNK